MKERAFRERFPMTAQLAILVWVACNAPPSPATAPALTQPPATQSATLPGTTQPSFTDVLWRIKDDGAMLDPGLVARLQLTPRQTDAVSAIFERYDQERLALRNRHAAALMDIADAMSAARRGGPDADAQAIEERLGDHEPYFRDMLFLLQRTRMQIRKSLTAEQNLHWEMLGVRRQLESQGLSGAQLSNDQQGRLRGVCESAARRLMALGDERSAAAVRHVLDAAIRDCRKDVLTPEQCRDLGYPWVSLRELLHQGGPASAPALPDDLPPATPRRGPTNNAIQ